MTFSWRYGRWCKKNSIRIEYWKPEECFFFSISCDFSTVYNVKYNVMWCVVHEHEHFVVSQYFIYYERTNCKLSNCNVVSLSLFTYNLTDSNCLIGYTARHTQKKRRKTMLHCCEHYDSSLPLMQFLNGLFNVMKK